MIANAPVAGGLKVFVGFWVAQIEKYLTGVLPRFGQLFRLFCLIRGVRPDKGLEQASKFPGVKG